MFGDVSGDALESKEASDSLESILRRERNLGQKPRSLAQAMVLLRPVVDAIAALHARGECHRELTPAAIAVGDALGEPGRATARLSHVSHAVSACNAYRAPEQFSEAYGIAGPWTDVFALALVVVTVLSDAEPRSRFLEFSAFSDAGGESWNAFGGTPVPAPVDAVLVRALSVYPAERYQTVGSFWAALRAATRRDASFAA